MKFIRYMIDAHFFYMKHDGKVHMAYWRFMKSMAKDWKYVKHTWMMIILLCMTLSSCGSAGFYAKSSKGSEVAILLPGIIAKTTAKNAKLKTPEGLEITVEAYASRQPDPDVTKQLGTYGTARLLAPIAMESVKGANAVDLKGTKDPNIIPKDPNVIPVDPQFVPPTQP